ncbi:MAG: Ribosomal RNA small subunit methyltransferase D [Dehalococcoidia bacterium]|nr:Ribosomal RNA small subunit methyltransferase D [Chloroflexota bacterium]
MRVIAGRAKGHPLKSPRDAHIRPTVDLVRGAIFSALESLSVDWSHALDLYAGSGALGIEALSRGAEEVDFVERNHRCCSIIKENLKHTGLAESSHVYRMEARKALRTLKKRYTLIFLDPPYFDRSGHTILAEVADSDLVGKQTTIVMEHSQKLSPEETCGNFQMIRRLRHGDTCVSIYQFAGGED